MRYPLGLAVACALALSPESAFTSTTDTPQPTEGRLRAQVAGEAVDVPLAHTDVRIRIDGHLADATVTQSFRNPYDDKLNAVYMFPLPTGAAVSSMRIETNGHVVNATIRKREDAVRVYERARKKGFVAALLTQERPNLFTQSVANIEPGAQVDVTIRYVQALPYERGRYEVVFPMVAGARYVPASSANSDAPAVQPAVLPPGKRSSHDISLFVQVDAGVPVVDLASPSHDLEVTRDDTGRRVAVSLGAGDTIPNKDFVLRYQVGGDAPEFAVLAHRDGTEGAFFLIAQPPAHVEDHDVAPREIVFVLDTSSSMAGKPLDKAKQVIRKVLAGLKPHDTFQIVRFDDAASALGPDPIANKPANLRYVYDWLDALTAAGGTEMTQGIDAALAVPHSAQRLRIVVFLTDGFIGNEDEILAQVANDLGESRLFSFGVGSSVNRYLLEEMALLGRGEAQVVTPGEDTDRVVDAFYRRIDRPVLTDLSIDWGDLPVSDVVPAATPDLFAGQPLVLAGHYESTASGTVTVRGKRAGRDVSFEVPVVLPERRARPAVATIWVRRRIAELSRRLVRKADPALVAQIVDLSLRHSVLTRYTAFVAVDDSRVTDGGEAKTMKVPVEVPAGVSRISRAATSGVMGYGVGGGGTGYGTIGHGSYGAVATRAASPAPRVMIASARVDGDLDKGMIRRRIRTRLPAIRHCYERELVADPTLEGKLVVDLEIDGAGKIVKVEATGLGNDAVEACVAKTLRTIAFPATNRDQIVRVRYPFVFRTAGDN